jgi:hypothetical protein
MPRFFFNLRCPEGAIIDPDGADFATPEEARDAAVATARNLLANDTENQAEWIRSVFEVADEGGEVVCEVPFRETTSLVESPTRH